MEAKNINGFVEYKLPELPYAYGDLDPVFTAEMVELHYSKHHAGYINKLNDLLQKIGYEAPKEIDDLIAGLKYSSIPKEFRAMVRFNAGGHANHRFFWKILRPIRESDSQNEPPQVLKEAIEKGFGSFDQFKQTFMQAAMGHLGSGWAWLCVSDKKKLFITTTLNHDHPLMAEFVGTQQFGTPILTLDLWEHAYYLKYKNQKADYFDAFWKIVNWDEVFERYQKVCS